MTAAATSPKAICETRKKLTVIHEMRKRKAELQDELAKVMTEVNKKEIEIEKKEEELRRTKQRALQEVSSVRMEQQKTLKEMKSSINGLKSKIPLLKKERDRLVQDCNQEKIDIKEYANLLDEKERKLEELKQVLQNKREELKGLEDERKELEIRFGRELEKAKADRTHNIEKENRRFQMYMNEKIEIYETKKNEIEKYLGEIKEERKYLYDTINLYAERAALLQEKKELLIKEYHCLLSSELEFNDELFKIALRETMGEGDLEQQKSQKSKQKSRKKQNEPRESSF